MNITPEIEEFLLKHGRDAAATYAQLMRMVVGQFGADRALRHQDLVRFFKKHGGKPYPTKLDRDPEVAAWVRARVGSMRLDALHTACLEAFGTERAPNVGVLERYLRRFIGAKATKKRRTRRIDTDPALRALLARQARLNGIAQRGRKETPTLDEIRATCAKELGEERTPSRATIQRSLKLLDLARKARKDGGA